MVGLQSKVTDFRTWLSWCVVSSSLEQDLLYINFLTKNCILITGAVMVWRKGNRKAKAKPSTKQVFLNAHVFLPVHCVSQGCAEVFTPADRAVLLQGFHVNTIKPGQLCWWGCGHSMCKEKDKTACQISSSLFLGSMSAAVLVEVHLRKGLWPEETCWIQELSSDNHMAQRLQLACEVTEKRISKNTHSSTLVFWAMNCHLQDQFVLGLR